MDAKAIRRRNLERLITEFGGIAPLAEAVGTDPNYLSALRKPRPGRSGMGDKMARKIEAGTKRPQGWMDRDHPEFDNKYLDGNNLGNVSHIQANLRRLPLISWVQAGQWNEAVDMFEPGYAEEWELTAERVGENAFALRVDGDSMEPEFPAGSIIIVDPSVEPQNGDYVIAKVRGAATFKRLSYDAGRAYLRPLNTDYKTLEMPEDGEVVGVVVAQNKRYR